MGRNYNQNTLFRMRSRHKALKCQFISIKLYVDAHLVDLSTFQMEEGVDFEFSPKGFKLLKKYVFIVEWTRGSKYHQTKLVADVDYDADGADVPRSLQKWIGDRLSPLFMIGSLGHDLAIEQKELPHEVESLILYKLLHAQKGKLDVPVWKERTMFIGVYLWSILTS